MKIIIANGTCGMSCNWELESEGVLNIYGEGEMFNVNNDCVFERYANVIKKVNIHEGVTYVGENTFNGFHSLKLIVLPTTIRSIGKNAFSNCKNLRFLYLAGTFQIGENVFTGIASNPVITRYRSYAQ